MQKIKLLLILGFGISFLSCAPTIVTKTIVETTDPDGRKTVTVTKSISQHLQTLETPSTTDVLNTLK
jgi:hypothetical protein